MKKLISTMMAIVMVLAIAMGGVGCGGGKDDKVKIDPNRTQLYVSNLDRGVGRTYITEIGKAFEEAFKDKSFEEGKKGVQVMYNHNTNIDGNAFYESMQNDEDNVYFTENVKYYQYASKFMDVTDIINAPAVTGYDAATGNYTYESKPIAEKIDPVMLSYLNRGNDDNPVYRAFPFYLAIKSVNYNADLWNDNYFYLAYGGAPSEYVAYVVNNKASFADDAAFEGALATAKANYNTEIAKIKAGQPSNAWVFVNAEGKTASGEQLGEAGKRLSAGPDGRYGTFDDGFPATYDEFYALCTKMSTTVTPFIWTGANAGYADMLTQSLFTNDMGLERTKTFYSLNGTVDNLVKLDSEGNIVYGQDGQPVLESITFDGGEDNGYEIQRTQSKLYALQFAEQIASNPTWTDAACHNSTSQSEAQNYYLTYGYTKTSYKKIAMLMDGAWWQQEANSTFETMAKKDAKYAKENRNFGVLSLPNSTIDRFAEKAIAGEKNVIVTENDSFCFINNNINPSKPQYELSRLFMSFFNSDAMAGLFTAETNMLRALDIDLESNEYWDKMSPFGKSFVEFGEGVEIMYPYSDNEFMNNNRTVFGNSRDGWQWHTFTGKVEASYPISTIKTYKSEGLDAKEYFEGLYNYYKNTAWKQLNK